MDESRIDYACDVVLVTDFATRQALRDAAEHPEHLRTARHPVDHEVPTGKDAP